MSEHASPKAKPPVVESIVPILSVANLAASLEYYGRILGFEKDWDWGEDSAKPTFASVSRNHHPIMLCQDCQGHAGTWFWLGVDDAEKLFQIYLAAGAKILMPPTNYPWALEFRIQDPDGHVLRFGSEPLEGRPFAQ